ncbi:unnamed protein product, partial [Strongylus vulgaris]
QLSSEVSVEELFTSLGYLKQQAEERFGNWWSAVIVGDRGGYGMSAVYDKYRNTRVDTTRTQAIVMRFSFANTHLAPVLVWFKVFT